MAVPGIATGIENRLDALVTAWTNSASASFAGILVPLALAGFTVYITLLGWQIMRGEAADPLHVIVKRLLMLAVIGGLALTVGVYQVYVVGLVNGAQAAMIQGINASTVNGGVPITLTIGGMIDNIGTVYTNLYNLLSQNFTAHLVPNFAVIIGGIIVAVAEFIVVIVCLGVYLIAKIELAMCLALGPVFILLAAFEQTREWTKRWIGQLFHYVVQVALIAASISILQASLMQVATGAYNNYQNNGGTSVFADVFALFILSCVVTLLVKNVGELARALTGAVGGIAHDSVIGPVNKAQSAAAAVATKGMSRLAQRAWGGMRWGGKGNSISPAGGGGGGSSGGSVSGSSGNIPASQAGVIANLAS
jgi:type IV secretion system protein VirB6